MIITWCRLKKFLHKPLSGTPQKCFQSGPAFAKAGPGKQYQLSAKTKDWTYSFQWWQPCWPGGYSDYAIYINLKRSGESTNPCRSPTPRANGVVLLQRHRHKFLSRNKMTSQPATGSRQHLIPIALPKVFYEKHGRLVSRGRQNMCKCLWHRFLQNLLQSENLVFSATAGTKTALGIIQLSFNYFVASFFKALGIHFSRETKEGDAMVASVFSPVSFASCVSGWSSRFANLSLPFRNIPGYLTHTSQPSNNRFKTLSISRQISWKREAFPTFSVLTTTGRLSVPVTVFSSTKRTSYTSDGMRVTGIESTDSCV